MKAKLTQIGGWLTLCSGAVLTAFALATPVKGAAEQNHYVGAAKCKNCHDTKAGGDAWGKWNEVKHHEAYKMLAEAKALEAGKKLGVAAPQKDPKCLKCHTTAFDKSADLLAKTFDKTQGVQCESCHGPGEKHVRARLAADEGDDDGGFGGDEGEEQAARQEIPKGEIDAAPTAKTCKECHNADSPNYKAFCFKHFTKAISHRDPRKQRTEAELKALDCACGGKELECVCKDPKCCPDDICDHKGSK